MYNSKLVCSLKSSKGQILREFKDVVYIPFGEEYSIYLKNLNTVRVGVSISIDGEDVLSGGELIIDANSDVNLERYISSLTSGNRFKFIERTSNIEKHRGVKAEDGLIRVEFEFERPQLKPFYSNEIWKSSLPDNSRLLSQNANSSYSATYCSVQSSATQNDVGITVPGSVSDQKFSTVSNFIGDGEKHVIVLKLAGELGQAAVQQPVTVKTKQKCITCGKINKATSKFCQECGTSLQIIS